MKGEELAMVYISKVYKDINSAIEQLWQSGMFNLPEDTAAEAKDIVDKWLAGFFDICHCNRPLRDCNCP